jgi:hypothetical protein
MKMFRRIIGIFIVSILFLNFSCSLNRVQSSNEFVERLNTQIKSGDFKQIYNEASDASKVGTSKEEFLENMKSIINEMKEVDESLAWQRDENILLSNGDIARDLYFVYRKVERNGKKLDITITVSYRSWTPEFYDLCVSPSESTTDASETCVTNALSKI